MNRQRYIFRKQKIIPPPQKNDTNNKNRDYHLHPIYVISILDFIMQHDSSWPQDRFYYRLQEETNHENYSDILNFIFIKLPRFNKVAEEIGDDIDRWMYLFKNMAKLQSIPKNFGKS